MSHDWVEVGLHFADLSAQRFDVGINGSVQGGFGLVPHQLHQLIASVYAAGMFQKNFEETKFVARKTEILSVELRLIAFQIDVKPTEFKV